MPYQPRYDVVIVGGSYSGLAAGMALGRALRTVLIIDSAQSCNRTAPYSHNFITHDGSRPDEIRQLAREQVLAYDTIHMIRGEVVKGHRSEDELVVELSDGRTYAGRKIIFATGIADQMLNIDGFTECWGVSVLHCPYCHGFEVRGLVTGVIGNGTGGYEYAQLISNWTTRLTLFTNGPSELTPTETTALKEKGIRIEVFPIAQVNASNGFISSVRLTSGSEVPLSVLYARCPFKQHCAVPEQLGCAITDEGYIRVDNSLQTSIDNVYACGDNSSPMRTVANAVATGTAVGMHVNRALL